MNMAWVAVRPPLRIVMECSVCHRFLELEKFRPHHPAYACRSCEVAGGSGSRPRPSESRGRPPSQSRRPRTIKRTDRGHNWIDTYPKLRPNRTGTVPKTEKTSENGHFSGNKAGMRSVDGRFTDESGAESPVRTDSDPLTTFIDRNRAPLRYVRDQDDTESRGDEQE